MEFFLSLITLFPMLVLSRTEVHFCWFDKILCSKRSTALEYYDVFGDKIGDQRAMLNT